MYLQPNNFTSEDIESEVMINGWEKDVLNQCMLNYAGFYDFTTAEQRKEIYQKIKWELFLKGWILLLTYPHDKRLAIFVDKNHGTAAFFEKLHSDIIVLEIGGSSYKDLREWVKYNLGFEQTDEEQDEAICRLINGDLVRLTPN